MMTSESFLRGSVGLKKTSNIQLPTVAEKEKTKKRSNTLLRWTKRKKKIQYNDEVAFIKAIGDGKVEIIQSFLINNPSLLQYADKTRRTPLHHALEANHTTVVAELLKFGADCTKTDENGWNALHFGAFTKNEKIMMLLLFQPRVDVSAPTIDENTPLHYFAKNFTIISRCLFVLLIKRGAAVNARNRSKETPLHYAAWAGNLIAVELLLEFGADANAQTKRLETALHIATRSNNQKMISLLVLQGADPSIQSRGGTALEIASNEQVHSLIITKMSERTKSFYDYSEDSSSESEDLSIVKPKRRKQTLRSRKREGTKTQEEIRRYTEEEIESKRRYELTFFDDSGLLRTFNDDNWLDFTRECPLRKQCNLKITISRLFHWFYTLCDTGKTNLLTPMVWVRAYVITSDNEEVRRNFLNLMTKASYQIRIARNPPPPPLRAAVEEEEEKISSEFPSATSSLDVHRYPWEIDFSELKIGKMIGRGSFGDVFKGEWRGNAVAIKKCVHELQSIELKRFMHEISLLSRIKHPNIITFYGACCEGEQVCMVLEFAHLGNLHNFLQHKHSKLTWSTRLNMSLDVGLGMQYLYSLQPPIFHRDLKTPNLLVDKSLKIKVSDFGLSKSMGQQSIGSKTEYGTINWLAPEVLDMTRPFTEKADVFSFGMVLWQIETGKMPFAEASLLQIVRCLDEGKRPEIPATCDPDFTKLTQLCWATNPEVRPTFNEIVQTLSAIKKNLGEHVRQNPILLESRTDVRATHEESDEDAGSSPSYSEEDAEEPELTQFLSAMEVTDTKPARTFQTARPSQYDCSQKNEDYDSCDELSEPEVDTFSPENPFIH